jgi:hypothetical protein
VAANGSTGNVYLTRTEFTKAEVFAPPPILALTINTAGGTGTGAVNCEVSGTIDEPCAAQYPEGSEIKLIPAPGAKSEFAGYSGATGSIACAGTAACEFELTADSSVNATFSAPLLTVLKSGNGSGTVTGGSPAETNTINCGSGSGCQHVYLPGAIVTLVGASDPGSQAVVWTGCGAVVGTNECEVTMTAAKNVTATFNLNPQLLTVTKAGTGGGSVTGGSPAEPNTINCGATCEHPYIGGAIVKLKGAPFVGSQTVVWAGCDAIVGTNECEVAMTAAKGVTATFPLTKHKLTVSKSGTGEGTITSNPAGIDCGTGAGCEFEFDHNTVVTLSAVAGEHSKPVVWEGCASEPSPTECKVMMGAAKEVKAKFDLITHTLTVNKAGTGSGSFTCNGGPCAASYPDGTVLTIAASPSAGSSFAGFSGGGCSGTAPCALTLNADTAVTATFTANPVVTPPPPPPAETKCVVPKLAKKTLGQAKSALKAANCVLGKVTKPKKSKSALVVKSTSPAAGKSLPSGSKVNLKLGPKPKKKK